jgi:hypothetical protein
LDKAIYCGPPDRGYQEAFPASPPSLRPAILRRRGGLVADAGDFFLVSALLQRWLSSQFCKEPSCFDTSLESPQAAQTERIIRRDSERSSVRVNAAGEGMAGSDRAHLYLQAQVSEQTMSFCAGARKLAQKLWKG